MMSKVNLIVINQHNVKLLTPLLTEPQLLSAAGLTYQSGIGLLGFAMIAASEQLFAIQVQQQVVGIILLGRQYDEHGTILPGQWTVGYAVLPAFQRRGIATAAVLQLINQFRQQHSAGTIIAEVREDNYSSQAVVRHCGFAQVACRNGIEKWQWTWHH